MDKFLGAFAELDHPARHPTPPHRHPEPSPRHPEFISGSGLGDLQTTASPTEIYLIT